MASVVLEDDSIESLAKSIKWGRNILISCQRYL